MSEITLKQQQQQFASHLRAPEQFAEPTAIEPRRMAIYRDLFFNNIESFISSAFPVFRSLFDEQEWLLLVRDFFTQHKAQSPYFLEISEEFLAWLNDDTLAIHSRFPFARELCHYEWLELALDVASDINDNAFEPEGDLFAQAIVLSKVIWTQAYAWPVHEIGKNNIPSILPNQASCLLVYRNEKLAIEFIQVNVATIRLIELIEEHFNMSGETVIGLLAKEMGQPMSESFIQFALETLEKLRSLGIVLGATSL